MLIQLGRYQQADAHLARLEKELKSSGVAYLRLCDAKAFRFWHQDLFIEAIPHGRRAVELKAGADINLDPRFNLALALRDSRAAPNVKEALDLFLEGTSLELMLAEAPGVEKKHMSYYGNVGRCLQFLGANTQAIDCYKKSLMIAASRHQGFSIVRNKAYAYWWIGEIYEADGQSFIAAHFYKYAEILWHRTCPPNARKMTALLNSLVSEDEALAGISAKSELEVSNYCSSKIVNPPSVANSVTQ